MNSTLTNTINLVDYYKSLGEKAIAQVKDEALGWTPDEKSNSISVIVKHLHGNMLSRWTDFLTTDGEKPLHPHPLYLILLAGPHYSFDKFHSSHAILHARIV